MRWKNGKLISTTIEEIKQRMRPLSKETQEARRPVSPEYLVDALQDSIHKEIGKSRPAKVAKRKPKKYPYNHSQISLVFLVTSTKG